MCQTLLDSATWCRIFHNPTLMLLSHRSKDVSCVLNSDVILATPSSFIAFAEQNYGECKENGRLHQECRRSVIHIAAHHSALDCLDFHLPMSVIRQFCIQLQWGIFPSSILIWIRIYPCHCLCNLQAFLTLEFSNTPSLTYNAKCQSLCDGDN